MVLSSTQVKLGARLAITPKLLLTSSELGPRKQISMTFKVMHLFREIPFKNRYIIIENIVCNYIMAGHAIVVAKDITLLFYHGNAVILTLW